MCQAILSQIKDFEAVHGVSPQWFVSTWMAYNACLRELEQATGRRYTSLSIYDVEVVVMEMCEQYERTTEPLH
jgi:hypothetical protein